eukprot:scaffold15689_cov135-Isochrysis_galbana.AAC.10
MDFRASGVGPLLRGPAGSCGRGGGGAQLVGSISPLGLRRGWDEVGRGVASFPVVRVHHTLCGRLLAGASGVNPTLGEPAGGGGGGVPSWWEAHYP